jgi:8-oxo-dGTP diphosphatase
MPDGTRDRHVAGAEEHVDAEGQAEVEDAHGSGIPLRPSGGRPSPAAGSIMSEPRRTIRVVAAVVEKSGQYLITQRRPNAVLPLLWEFPGGKVEAGETDGEALARELLERLGVTAEVGEWISETVWDYEHYRVALTLYECETHGTLEPRGVHGYRWVTSDEFDQFEFTPADEASMNRLLGVYDA